MDISMTRSQMGLLLTVVGTVALAFSLRTKSQYTGEIAKVVKKAMRNNSRRLRRWSMYHPSIVLGRTISSGSWRTLTMVNDFSRSQVVLGNAIMVQAALGHTNY